MTVAQRRLLTTTLLAVAVLCVVGATLPILAVVTGFVETPTAPAGWIAAALLGLPALLMGAVLFALGLYACAGGYE